ncbi:ribonuclease H-like domain-containing protein [Tanacetum coccineum]
MQGGRTQEKVEFKELDKAACKLLRNEGGASLRCLDCMIAFKKGRKQGNRSREPHLAALKWVLRYVCGYYVFFGDNLLSWSLKRQHTLSRSSVEPEYHGVANVVAETAWLVNLALWIAITHALVDEMKELEILIICDTGIKEFSQEIGELVNLSRLDATNCKNLSRVVPGVISKLWRLAELCIGFMSVEVVAVGNCYLITNNITINIL